jgi:penicillin-binding protein 2A
MGWKMVLISSVTAFTFVTVAGVSAAVWMINRTPIDVSKLTTTVEPTVVYDNKGSVYMELGHSSSNLDYDQIPVNLQDALVATEDHGFWSGSGIDIRGIFRSVLVDLAKGAADQGASTIPEQLAKITYLNDNRTLSYKLWLLD